MPANTPEAKPCKNCGTEFKPKRKWQDFCSHDCRSKWHNKQYADFKQTKEGKNK